MVNDLACRSLDHCGIAKPIVKGLAAHIQFAGLHAQLRRIFQQRADQPFVSWTTQTVTRVAGPLEPFFQDGPTATAPMPTSRRFFFKLARPSSSFLASVNSLAQQYRRGQSVGRELSFDARVSLLSVIFLYDQPHFRLARNLQQLRHRQRRLHPAARCSSRALFGGFAFSCQISRRLFFRPLFQSRRGLCRVARRCAGWNIGFSLGSTP